MTCPQRTKGKMRKPIGNEKKAMNINTNEIKKCLQIFYNYLKKHLKHLKS